MSPTRRALPLPPLRLTIGALLLGAALAAATPARADDSLFTALGGDAGVKALSDTLIERATKDPRMAQHFKDSDLKRVKAKLAEQVCELAGGPCKYSGDPMREVHEGMKLTRADFNALVEVTQDAMDAQGIPFATQNRLLALLAPMHRDIVAPR